MGSWSKRIASPTFTDLVDEFMGEVKAMSVDQHGDWQYFVFMRLHKDGTRPTCTRTQR